jgi:hypothetical protein
MVQGHRQEQNPVLGIVNNRRISQADVDANIDADEKVVTAAYDKLIMYSRAAALDRLDRKVVLVTPDLVLHFSLKNFQTGSIEDLKSKHESEVVTMPEVEVIQITQGNNSINNGPKEATYTAAWDNLKTQDQPRLTIGEAFQILGNEYVNVRRYTAYDVTVTFEGRSRSYRALMLVHEQPGEQRFGFWDRVGAGGALTSAFNEKLPPKGSRQDTNFGP